MGKAENRNTETSKVKSFNEREFKTNIPSLDRLLGYNEELGSGTGIKAGDIIVLRGGPGSGKTTLGLQIMSNYLASDECRFIEKNPAVVFLSLEIEPNKAIEKVKKDYGFFKEEQRPCLIPVPLNEINNIAIKLGKKFSKSQLGNVERGVLKAIVKGLTYPLGPAAIPIEEPAKELIEPVANRLVCFINSLTQNRNIKTPKEDNSGGILFIDSINALIALIRQNHQGGEWEPRLVLKHACELLKSTFGNFVILASSEFHHEASWIPPGISESFLSDVEILLGSEPITAPAGYQAGQQGAVGYNIFKIIEKVEGGEGTKLESRSFIRVLKNRKGANQSRRCAYDIVSGEGIRFYETYPADGHILLFRENPMQEQVWDTFFKEDLPQIYPALRYEVFGRYGLQRTFLNQRRSRDVPIRTDMYVSSFDNYWINWHGELCWRRAIVDIVGQKIQDIDQIRNIERPEKERQRIVAELASEIHKSLMKQPVSLEKCLDKKLKDCLSRSNTSEKSEILREILIAFAVLFRRENCLKCFLCRGCLWVLRKISKQADFDTICESWAKNEDGTDVDILKDMCKLAKDMDCQENQVSKFFNAIRGIVANQVDEKPQKGYAKKLLRQWMRSGYEVSFSEEYRAKLAKEIYRILIKEGENYAAELSKKISGIKELRSNRVRNKLEKKLLRLRSTSGEKLRTDIEKELSECFEQERGCECHVEFWRHLSSTLSEEIAEFEQERQQLSEEIAELEKRRKQFSKKIAKLKKKHERLSEKIERFRQIRDLLLEQRCEIVNELFEVLPFVLLKDRREELIRDNRERAKKAESIVSLWKKLTKQQEDNPIRYNLIITYYEILKRRNWYHFLSRMPKEKLRLFGERRSEVIEELEKPSTHDKRPIHRPGLPFSLRDSRSFVAVPYDANISFMVCRHDLLEKFLKEDFFWQDKNGPDGYAEAVLKLYEEELTDLNQTPALTKEQKSKVKVSVKENITNYLAFLEKEGRKTSDAKGGLENIRQYLTSLKKKRGKGKTANSKKDEENNGGSEEKMESPNIPVQTWEELIVLLQWMNEAEKNKEGDKKSKRHFAIETQSLDTLLCTVLECFWNCGGDSKIRPDYSIENEPDTQKKLFQALYLLGKMLQDGIIPDDSTLDVALFGERYGNPKKQDKPDWVFARYWYTTLVDLLTAKDKKKKHFLWENPDAELRIMPIPISMSYYLEKKEDAHHVSCWGDWHWIMTRGTENTELGIGMINNLMSSQKVCERAFQCAAIPTVKGFYEMHGESNCLNLPERSYKTPKMLPNITFNKLKETYFHYARSRSEIFDYEHCMLELQSLFQFVRSLVKDRDKEPDWGKLNEEIGKAFGRIKELRTKLTLTV